MARSPEAGRTVATAAVARRASPALILAAIICVALLLAYLGNAAWNLTRLGQFDASQFLAAATLPFPIARQPAPQWIEFVSAAVFLLLVALIAITLRAVITARSRRAKSSPYAVAETSDIFIADKTRISARPAPIASPKPIERDDMPPSI
jgi:hypothetical protein